MAHLHNVYDNDAYFVIDAVTRKITNTGTKNKLLQYDHNSERFTFEIPRFVEGHDTTLCNKVEIHYINVASNKSGQSEDVYIVDDLLVDEWDENKAVFSWLISANATKYAGTLNFLIRFVCLDGETITYAWNTSIHSDIVIDSGMDNAGAVIVEYSDVLARWEEEIKQLAAEVERDKGVPEYWVQHIEQKAVEIRKAMESAGRKKSAFLWYTDAHWNLNHKQSPKLLKYLHEHTPISKVNFGGDIVQDEPTQEIVDDTVEMSYVYDWRNAVRCLPNHHSVVGNHDDGSHVDNRFSDECIYSYLLAAEESNNVVYGDGFYYYIDDKAEKTRYLYLDTAYKTGDDAQAKFLVDSLTSTPDGWHIVAIAHIWHDAMWSEEKGDYLGDYSAIAGKFLKVMYDYNHKTSGSIKVNSTAHAYDFSKCGGKAEFCIGGHIHWDNVSYYNDEIPVILTETDSTRERVNITAVKGTIDENAVNAVVADYAKGKIEVIRVGRGQSFTVSLDGGIVYHTIVQNLTNVSSSNADISVAHGGSFETTLTATSGELASVTVTIDGDDVTSEVYTDGVVVIPSVTGTVVITAAAETETPEPDEPDAPTYTNVLKTAEAYDSTAIYNGVGYKADVRPSTSTGTGETACAGMYTTGYIPYNGQTKLYLKNVGFKADVADPDQCVIQAWSSKTVRYDGSKIDQILSSSDYAPVTDATGAITELTLPNWFKENCAYIRICCGYIGGDSIITLDELID